MQSRMGMAGKVLGMSLGVLLAGMSLEAYAGGNVNDPGVQKKIEQLTGARGESHVAENVFKVNLPRNDLRATADGVKLTPPLGLTAWAGFQQAGDQVMVMGDLPLTEDQVTPVLDTALQNGLEVTAIHNHFAHDSPRIMFMHIGGMGDLDRLAAGVGAVFKKIKEPVRETKAVPLDPRLSTLNPLKLDAVFGIKGQMSAGVYKVVFGRTTAMHGHTSGAVMGISTWAAFAGSDGQAVVDGDFAMQASEVQGVLKTLRRAGIQIVALHSHMLEESPRIFFLHFWGRGLSEDLARGLKSALGATGRK